MNYYKLREWLSEQEHIQWEHWSKAVAEDLKLINVYNYREDFFAVENRIKARLENWEKNWKPYKNLPEDIKEYDRKWADKILDSVPFKCPVYQCGGLMKAKEKPHPKGKGEDDFPDGRAGDTQTPDLVCSNCGAIYSFQRFKNARRVHKKSN